MFGIAVVGFFWRIAFRTRVEGVDRVPSSGPAIVAGNHVSALDGVVLTLVTGSQGRRSDTFPGRGGVLPQALVRVGAPLVPSDPAPSRRARPGRPRHRDRDDPRRCPRGDLPGGDGQPGAGDRIVAWSQGRGQDRPRDRGARGPGRSLGNAGAVAEARSALPTSVAPGRRGLVRRPDPAEGGPGFDRGPPSLHRPRWWMRSPSRRTERGRSPRRSAVRERGRRTTPPRARRRVRARPVPRRGGWPRGRSRAASRTASEPAPAG